MAVRRGGVGATSTRPALRILFATAEMYPFAKIGGLADVSGALPKQLAAMGHDVRVVMPAYQGLGGETLLELDVPFGRVTESLAVRRLAVHEGVEVLTIGSAEWFDRETPYGYQDEDVLPFVLFGRAVAAYAARSAWRPDVIHGNDWHCGLIAQEAREGTNRQRLDGVAVVFTIHNIAYQGRVGAAIDELIGLPRRGSLLARGISFADQVNTVSSRYLEELLTPAYGAGMEDLLRSRRSDVRGILNGVDYAEFSPERDPWIDTRYDGAFVVGKRRNKRQLQRESALELDGHRPMFAVVSRLVAQKGINLVCRAVDGLVARGGQVVVMGTGERRYRYALRSAAARHPGSVAYHDSTEEGLARRLYAGADLFLAPSAFEPCGLTPLISLRYGTIPVVRRTGGMADTIVDYSQDPAAGLGFTFGPRRVDSMLAAVDEALEVHRHPQKWRALQVRAMAADFSWRRPAEEYVAMYAAAVERRRRRTEEVAVQLSATSAAPTFPLPIALVHHANQYLITDGYPDREGLSALVRGYAALLRLHERYQVPAHLHLSGTLVEAAAWRHPEFLQQVKRLHERRLVTLIGGAYSESVLPDFGDEFKSRQLRKLLWLYERHLGCRPEELSIFWVPERVWRTDALAPTITDPTLPNGGYRYVLLDDRLLYPTDGQYGGSDRELFDRADPSTAPPADAARLYRIEGGNGLHVLPLSTRLRYWVPPADRSAWTSLARLTGMSVAPGDDTVVIYADDMEKTAGVGPWDARHLERYEAFLRWLVVQPALLPVSLPAWLAQRRRPAATREIQPGTFLELARGWEAGEDYSGWSTDAAWRPYRRHLADSEAAVLAAERAGAEPQLLELAWTHLLASGYETGWRDTTRPDHPPAPWAKALASHARSSIVLADAASWFASATPGSLRAERVDLDRDGEDEVVLANNDLYAVLAPRHGGRLVYLASRTAAGGALVIGNPSDDWNWQEPLNSYMELPPNHPGALADTGAFHDRYVATVECRGDGVVCTLANVETTGPLVGVTKRLFLGPGDAALTVEYALGPDPVVVGNCLSPDYARLLREGWSELRRYDGSGWRGMRAGEVSVWLALDEAEGSSWSEAARAEVGHGVVVDLTLRGPTCHILVGTGPTDPFACSTLLGRGRAALAAVGPAAASTAGAAP